MVAEHEEVFNNLKLDTLGHAVVEAIAVYVYLEQCMLPSDCMGRQHLSFPAV